MSAKYDVQAKRTDGGPSTESITTKGILLKNLVASPFLYSAVILILTGCSGPKIVSDAFSADKKGNAYGYGIQVDWTSRSFEVLQSSKLSVQNQKIELMLLKLPVVFARRQCYPSEILEVRQMPFKATQKEVWKVRVCDEVKEVETKSAVGS